LVLTILVCRWLSLTILDCEPPPFASTLSQFFQTETSHAFLMRCIGKMRGNAAWENNANCLRHYDLVQAAHHCDHCRSWKVPKFPEEFCCCQAFQTVTPRDMPMLSLSVKDPWCTIQISSHIQAACY
jgi:hypothetical protein